MHTHTALLTLSLTVVAAAALAAPPPPCNLRPDSITIITAKSTTDNYAFGWAMGKATALQVAARRASPQFASFAAWAAANGTLMDALTANVKTTYPAYYAEAQGLADGAGIPVADVMIFNAYDEIETAMPPPPGGRDSQCTDVLIKTPPTRTVAHNEDGRTLNEGLMFMLDGEVPRVATGAPALIFTAYMYAGTLPTGAFAYTNSGLFFTLNGLFPIDLNAGGVPRAFIHRALLESLTLDAAYGVLSDTPAACGFSCNIGQLGDPQARLTNVEVSAVLPSSLLNVGPSPYYYYHANSYLRSPTPQLDDVSSDARLARLAQLPPPTTWASTLLLLGDTENTTYPIWREGAAPDCCATLLTAVFDVVTGVDGVESGTLSLITNNPHSCPAPLLVRSFGGGQGVGRG